jgi:hypothetical protein
MSNNGPTFTKATYKASRPECAPSQERHQLALEQLARDCERSREVNKLSSAGDYLGVLKKLGLLK